VQRLNLIINLKIAKCSKDTAIRDINDLIEKGILRKDSAGGRSTNYEVKGITEDNIQ
jgi:Fic family protein